MNVHIANNRSDWTSIRRLWPYRRVILWGLIAALALLLVLGVPGNVPAAAQPAADLQIARHPQAVTIVYTYDAAGRLITADYGGGSTLNYGYDATGNLANAEPWKMIYLPLVLRNYRP